MAKKRRKNFIKLNNKIKTIFNGESFENGILKLENRQLEGLFFLIFGEKPSLDRDELIRSLRRVWSEGDYKLRGDIVDFLQNKTPKPSGKRDIKTTIEEILKDEPSINEQEREALIESFIDANPTKLTKDKILTKLKYLRLKEKISKIEDTLDVEFNSLNEIEFVHSFEFDINSSTFHKLLLLRSQPIDIANFLSKESLEMVIEHIKRQKETLIESKKDEIKEFLNSLKNSNIYLTEKEAKRYLKRVPIDCELRNTPIDTEHLQKIVKDRVSKDIFLVENFDYIDIEMIRKYRLFSKDIYYKLKLSYQKHLFYSLIWDSKPLPILEDFEQLESTTIAEFELSLDELYSKMVELSRGLDIPDILIKEFILEHLSEYIKASTKLKLRAKTIRKILYHFREYIKPIKERKRKEELLAKSIRDFKLLYPLARKLKRKITFNVGQTNSGKTFSAMERLKSAQSGYYLAPLRLLALEGYESLREAGVNASLITGEEEIIDEESTHISSTIEMLNFDVEVDVCVIDEIQMIDDKDRGWAWVNALIGAPAKEIILTGSSSALEVVEYISNYLGEELEVVEFERKTPLKLLQKPTSLDDIEPNSAIVTFSRREVLSLKQRLSSKYSISVIYGNLSPEVRREEARRFREGDSSILIATDAIAMGLNLPIKTIIFARDNKFDGLRRRELEPIEVIQIAGRAGRYGLFEEGFVGAFDTKSLKSISKKMTQPLKSISLPLQVMPSLEHIILIGEILESDKLSEILNFFWENMEFEGPFIARDIESMMEVASIVDEYELDLKSKYIFSSAPVALHSPYLEMVFHKYLNMFAKGQKVAFHSVKDLPKYAHTQEELLEKEDRVKEVSLYLWLSFKFPESFEDIDEAIKSRDKLNRFIEETLKRGEFKKLCRVCKRELDFNYKFNICERCYRRRRY